MFQITIRNVQRHISEKSTIDKCKIRFLSSQLNSDKPSSLLKNDSTSIANDTEQEIIKKQLEDLKKNDNNLIFNRILNNLIDKLYSTIDFYEKIIGIKELKEIQSNVLKAEHKFSEAQETRRELSVNIIDIQSKLKEIREQMDRLQRSDSQYLKLFTMEHDYLNKENKYINEYKVKEEKERDLFYRLSALLRESQEKERQRAEYMKYIQLVLSVVCTCLGILGALIVSYLRRSEINNILFNENKLLNEFDIKLNKLNENVLSLLDTHEKTHQQALMFQNNQKDEEDSNGNNLTNELLLNKIETNISQVNRLDKDLNNFKYLTLISSIALCTFFYFTKS